jgi:4-coumarate--CoA ligase
LIKVKGLQVAPAELEGLLLSHPLVSDVAVVGIRDAHAGERPKAFVVLRDRTAGAVSARKSLHAFVCSKVSRHKWLNGGIEFVDSIPKSVSGKILRRTLKERENAAGPAAKL